MVLVVVQGLPQSCTGAHQKMIYPTSSPVNGARLEALTHNGATGLSDRILGYMFLALSVDAQTDGRGKWSNELDKLACQATHHLISVCFQKGSSHDGRKILEPTSDL